MFIALNILWLASPFIIDLANVAYRNLFDHIGTREFNIATSLHTAERMGSALFAMYGKLGSYCIDHATAIVKTVARYLE